MNDKKIPFFSMFLAIFLQSNGLQKSRSAEAKLFFAFIEKNS